MSHRANLVWIENGSTHLFFGGTPLGLYTCNLAIQGLDFCRKYIFNYPETEWLMNNSGAEGGLLVDCDNQILLVFGGSDLNIIPAYRNFYLHELNKIWGGWDVRWCLKGAFSMFEYIEKVEDYYPDSNYTPQSDVFTPGELFDDHTDFVVTVVQNGICRDYLFTFLIDLEQLAEYRPENIQFPESHLIEQWKVDDEVYQSVLLDFDHKRIFLFYSCGDTPSLEKDMAAQWEGWSIIRQYEGVRFHFAYTHRVSPVPDISPEVFEKLKISFSEPPPRHLEDTHNGIPYWLREE